MATTLYLLSTAGPPLHRGTNTANLAGTTGGWTVSPMSTSRGTSTTNQPTNTVTGATNGIEVVGLSGSQEWISQPLAADITISGTITLNLWAAESDMNANAAINAVIERLDATGAIVSQIAKTARVTEVAVTTSGVNNFTVTPTSTNMLTGERLRVRVFFDDVGTMAAGFTATFSWSGPTASVSGDSFVTFTENLTFLATDPSGSILYLTSTAGPSVSAADEREMWTSRGGSATTAVVNTATGWTAPIQWTASAGGSVIEWYSKPLTAFTLSGLVRLNLRTHESNASANAGIRAELAVTATDGSGAAVWASASLVDVTTAASTTLGSGTSFSGEPTTSEAAIRHWLAGASLAITDGQRLRLRVYVDDSATAALVTGFTATLTYNGTSGGATGDTWIQLGQTVTEYSLGPTDWPGTISTSWGGWTATAVGLEDHAATVTTAWGGWTATAAGTVTAGVFNWPGTITTGWGSMPATAVGTVEHPASVTTAWGTWTATATASIEHAATVATSWQGWTATATALAERRATITTGWGTAAATGIATVDHPATTATSWGTWTATGIVSVVDRAATIASAWGGWTATAVGQPIEGPATITTGWGAWTATGLTTVERPATIATGWGGWTATALGTQLGQIPAAITTTWGGWNATALAATDHAATITTTWGTATATAIGTASRTATITTTWDGLWTATTLATVERAATISTTWQTWTATAIGTTITVSGVIGQWNGVDVVEMMWGAEPVEDWMLV